MLYSDPGTRIALTRKPMSNKYRRAVELLLWSLPVMALAATAVVWRHIHRGADEAMCRRFESRVAGIEKVLSGAFLTADNMMHACAGLFAASDEVSRAEWRAFVEELDPTEYNPGVQSLGFIKRVPAASLAEFERSASRELPGFRVRPAGNGKDRFPVLYIEPRRSYGRRLEGYDMASEPALLESMLRAAESRETVSARRVQLSTPGPDGRPENGLIVFRPVYRRNARQDTPESRLAALDGFVYISLYAGRMFGRTVGASETGISLKASMAAAGYPAEKLYDSMEGRDGSGPPSGYGQGLSLTVERDRYGVRFRNEYEALSEFSEGVSFSQKLLAISGVLFACLLAWVAAVQMARNRALDREEDAAAALRIIQSAVDNSGNAIFLVNPDATLHYANQAAADLLGYGRDELLALSALDINPQYVTPEAWRANLSELKAKGKVVYEAPLKRKDGSHVPVEITATHAAYGGKEIKCVYCTDLTARKKAELQLRKLSLAIEAGPAAVMITDPEGAIEYVNPKFTEMTGYTREEALGRNPRMLKSGKQTAEFYRGMWETLKACRNWAGELQNRRKNGEIYWESVSIATVCGEDGRAQHYICVKEDIDARKRMEAELVRAKEEAESATRAKGVFLSSMSHEIRTPLNAVLGFSQLMRRDPELTERQRQQVDTINRSGRHLLALINDILEMSKIESGRAALNPAPFKPGTLLGDLEVMFRHRAEEKKLSFEVETRPGLPGYAMGDEGKLRQVLVNLLGNAFKFTAKGGVVLRASALPAGAGRFRLCAEVEDTGPGIAEDELETLFSPFEQARAGKASGGTGLGLSISREYARLMGGDISVSSRPGEGSVFRFEAVLEETSAAPAAGPEARVVKRLAPGQPSYRVLVADDKEDNREFLRQLLTLTGFEVRQAADGEAAVRNFSEWRPHIVLMDIRMPVLDGYEATRRIRALPGGKNAKVLILSASSMGDVRKESLECGADDYLPKPFRESDLFVRLEGLIGAAYEYQEESGPAPAAAAGPADLAPDVFADLPGDLRARLRSAAVSGDFDAVRELAAELEGARPAAAAAARGLAARFDAGGLLALLDGAPGPGA